MLKLFTLAAAFLPAVLGEGLVASADVDSHAPARRSLRAFDRVRDWLDVGNGVHDSSAQLGTALRKRRGPADSLDKGNIELLIRHGMSIPTNGYGHINPEAGERLIKYFNSKRHRFPRKAMNELNLALTIGIPEGFKLKNARR